MVKVCEKVQVVNSRKRSHEVMTIEQNIIFMVLKIVDSNR